VAFGNGITVTVNMQSHQQILLYSAITSSGPKIDDFAKNIPHRTLLDAIYGPEGIQ